MLCHSAVGACQIYVPVRVISIHYHDGYRSTKGNIVSFSLPLHNNCLFYKQFQPGKLHHRGYTQLRLRDCTLWVYLSELYEKVFKNKKAVCLPFAAQSCHVTFLREKQSERETSQLRYALWSQRSLKTHRHNKGRIFTRVFGTWCRLLHISEALLC